MTHNESNAMHLNVKPLDPNQTYETPAQAIAHVLTYQVFSKAWLSSQSFGQTIAARRAIDTAVRAKNAAAFVAHKRRGYWRVELAPAPAT